MSRATPPHATRIPLRKSDEEDALTAKHIYQPPAGVRRYFKRQYWQRFRRAVREGLRREAGD